MVKWNYCFVLWFKGCINYQDVFWPTEWNTCTCILGFILYETWIFKKNAVLFFLPVDTWCLLLSLCVCFFVSVFMLCHLKVLEALSFQVVLLPVGACIHASIWPWVCNCICPKSCYHDIFRTYEWVSSNLVEGLTLTGQLIHKILGLKGQRLRSNIGKNLALEP